MPADSFPKSTEARQLLANRAQELIERYLELSKKAEDSGDYATAIESLQWLISRLPSDVRGLKVIDPHIDKQQVQERPTGPQVNIGIQLGGVNSATQKRLPKPIVTSEPIDE